MKILSLTDYIFHLALGQTYILAMKPKLLVELITCLCLQQAQGRTFSTVAPHLNVVIDLPGAP